jgi:hypothetical protein
MSVEAFFDSNVFLYAASKYPADAAKSRCAARLITETRFGVSIQVVQEFYHNARIKARLAITAEQAPKWHHGAWAEFSKAICGDLNIEQTFGSLFLRMSGVKPAWSAFIDPDDLLAALVRREPQSADAYLRAMTRRSTERGPVLTEEAWQEIDAVTELPALRILCALILTCRDTANAHLFTRLFLEDSRFWPHLLGV